MHLKHYLLFFFAFSISTHSLSAKLDIEVNAEAAILINADTGAILFEKNAYKEMYPASMTKVATAAYALSIAEKKLDNKVTVDPEALIVVTEASKKKANYSVPAYWLVSDGSNIGLKKEEEMSLRHLLYGMVINSGNDASNAIALYLGGTIPKFMEGLNAYLKKIGCTQTTYYNPHGLHHPKHMTTAYDMALMMKAAIQYPLFVDMISSTQYDRPKTNKKEAVTLPQSNRLIRKGKYYYAKAIGGKTGFHSAAENTFVCVAKDKNRTLISVQMKSKSRDEIFRDTIALFDAAFKEKKMKKVLFAKGPQNFTLDLAGSSKPIHTYLQNDVVIEYYPAEEQKIKSYLVWTVTRPGIKKDQVIGKLQLQAEGKNLQEIPLLAQEDVSATWASYLRRLL